MTSVIWREGAGLRFPALSFALLLLVATTAAQQVDKRIFGKRAQEADGRWSALRYGGADYADVRVTSLMVLGYTADREWSPLYEDVLPPAVNWLVRCVDREGRAGYRPDPGWFLDHAIVSCALAEYYRLHGGEEVAACTERATKALVEYAQTARPSISAETMLWCEIAIQSVLLTNETSHPDRRALAVAPDSRRRLQEAGYAVGGSVREKAAQLLLTQLRGQELDIVPLESAVWPPDLAADPMSVFYLIVAHSRALDKAPVTEPPDMWPLVLERSAVVVDLWRKDGELRGSCDPAGEFGKEYGRIGTSAALSLVMLARWRKCGLWSSLSSEKALTK